MIRRDFERDSGRVNPGRIENTSPEESGREWQSGEEPATRYMRIDEVAKRTGLSKRTLRYYEELGLLEPAQRSQGNYRLYTMRDVASLQRIKEMRDLLGLELDEIREMVKYELERQEARTRFYHPDAEPPTRLGALDDAERVTREQLRLIETRIEALKKMNQSLRERLVTYERLRGEIKSQSAQPENSPEA
jgi:DNA-binding transcriptional MerR regulator